MNRDEIMFQSVLSAGRFALKLALIVNAVAAALVLVVICSSSIALYAALFAKPLLCFCYGVLVVAVAGGAIYLVQSAYKDWKITLGNTLNICACILVVCSYVLFIVGCNALCWGLTSIPAAASGL